MSAWVASSVGELRQPMRPSGAPAFTAASAMISAARFVQRAARGCGACTIALPALTAARDLNSVVAVGFVTGMIAAMTPIGEPMAVTLRSSSTQSTPIARCRSIQSATNPVLNRFFRILSS